MPTKAQLEHENAQLKMALKQLHENIDEALKDALDEGCEDVHPYIETFCSTTGIEYPTQIKKFEIPYGVDVDCIYDESGNEHEVREILNEY